MKNKILKKDQINLIFLTSYFEKFCRIAQNKGKGFKVNKFIYLLVRKLLFFILKEKNKDNLLFFFFSNFQKMIPFFIVKKRKYRNKKNLIPLAISSVIKQRNFALKMLLMRKKKLKNFYINIFVKDFLDLKKNQGFFYKELSQYNKKILENQKMVKN